MSASFDFGRPDHFTAGAVGPPGERVFYLQARQARRVATLKSEKEQVRLLARYLATLLAERPLASARIPGDLALLEPLDPAWSVARLAVGYDSDNDRVVVEAQELLEEEAGDEPATARFRITRAQAAGFVERAQALMQAGRPICPLCQRPMDAAGHICPRSNGHGVS
jgi:uncharacterized repeat protein (TIGR03847 family)